MYITAEAAKSDCYDMFQLWQLVLVVTNVDLLTALGSLAGFNVTLRARSTSLVCCSPPCWGAGAGAGAGARTRLSRGNTPPGSRASSRAGRCRGRAGTLPAVNIARVILIDYPPLTMTSSVPDPDKVSL